MGEPQKHYAKWNKPDKKSHILYDSIYMKFQNRQNKWKMIEIRLVVTGTEVGGLERARELFYVLIRGCDYTGVYICQNLRNHTLKMLFYCI